MSTTTSSDIATRIAQRLAEAVGPRRYAMWFDRSARLDYCDARQTLQVSVPNRFFADWIGRHFHDDLCEAARRELGQPVTLDLRVEPERFTQEEPAAPAAQRRSEATGRSRAPAATASRGAAEAEAPLGTTLSTLRHRLEDFVVGPSNELAYAAARSMVEDDEGTSVHPLFLHGGCGLGKTHLLQGLCRAVLERDPHARVLYTTGERFTNEYITAVRTNRLEAFRRRVRRLDLLAVDDVHFLANKQATQQEFLHSFDQIELGGAKVVLASDSHPKLIKQFSEALVSRCVRGLVVQVNPPDEATRLRLVQVLAQRRGLTLEPGLAQALARRGAASVREIEGMITKLQALAALARQSGQRVDGPIGYSLAQPLLEEGVPEMPRRPVRVEALIQTVAQQVGVTPQQILGTSRHRFVVLARALVIHLARQCTSMSYPEIAARMGRENHSTVITAAQRIQRQLKENPTLLLPAQAQPMTLMELLQRVQRELARAEA